MTSLKLSHLIAGFVAVLVGYTSSVAIIFQAIELLGATQAQANSWMLALGLGMGVSGLILSLWYKMPILTAWSTPGAALLVVSVDGVTMGQAVGAFLLCAVLLILTGVTGWFAALSKIIPDAIANAMLAGILFRFGLDVFAYLQTDTWMVAVMCLIYLAGRVLAPRFAIPLVLLAGAGIAWAQGVTLPEGGITLTLARPEFVMPSFSLPVLIGVGLPLFVVTMTSQNMPGVVTMRAAGYDLPVSPSITVTGVVSLLLAPFGGYAFNLAAITAAICAGQDADEDPRSRYMAAVVAGVIYCFVGLMGATVIGLFLIAPKALVVTVAGLALLGTIGNSLTAALQAPDHRDAALVTFMTTVSGISFFAIGAPVWGLLFGALTHGVLRIRRG